MPHEQPRLTTLQIVQDVMTEAELRCNFTPPGCKKCEHYPPARFPACRGLKRKAAIRIALWFINHRS
jgi:hypothetical protein